MTDFITKTSRVHVNNWLKNGNFLRLPRTVVAKSFPEPSISFTGTPYDAISDVLTQNDISLSVGKTAENEFLANWSIVGDSDGVGAVDIDPLDPVTGLRNRSYDSGNLARVSFFNSGVIVLSQDVEVVSQFRGMPATVALTGVRLQGNVGIKLVISFGNEAKTFGSFFSDSFGSYKRIIQVIEECPVGLTKIGIQIQFTGRRGSNVGISGVSFALGSYDISMPYTDALGDVALPRGTVILWTGDSCPPGFREVEESQDAFLYQVHGDPNLISGGTQEYPESSPSSAEAVIRPEPRTTLGDNEHFAHQTSNLFAEAIESFESSAPDVIKKLNSSDFNDLGEGTRRPSLVASAALGVAWPFQPSVRAQVERFKLSTVQHEVLPGGDKDWSNPHRHVFRSAGTPTLPPYFGVKVCEKI